MRSKKLRDEFELAQNPQNKKEVGRLKKQLPKKPNGRALEKQINTAKPSEKGSGGIFDTGFIGARAARTMKRSKTIEQRMYASNRSKRRALKGFRRRRSSQR